MGEGQLAPSPQPLRGGNRHGTRGAHIHSAKIKCMKTLGGPPGSFPQRTSMRLLAFYRRQTAFPDISKASGDALYDAK